MVSHDDHFHLVMVVWVRNLQKAVPVKELLLKLHSTFLLHVVGAGRFDVNLVCMGDEEIRDLNRSYRKVNSATDVLSFPYHEVLLQTVGGGGGGGGRSFGLGGGVILRATPFLKGSHFTMQRFVPDPTKVMGCFPPNVYVVCALCDRMYTLQPLSARTVSCTVTYQTLSVRVWSAKQGGLPQTANSNEVLNKDQACQLSPICCFQLGFHLYLHLSYNNMHKVSRPSLRAPICQVAVVTIQYFLPLAWTRG